MKRESKTGYCDLTYKDIIGEFTEQVVQERFAFLLQAAKLFVNNRYKEVLQAEDYFLVQEKIIGEIVLNYFSDIKRLKTFHNIDRVEPKKVASYTSYWIIRCKPIQTIKPIPNDIFISDRSITTVNELFACNILIAMAYNTKERLHEPDGDNYAKFREQLYYHLTYRITNPQALELALTALNASPIYGPIKEKG